MKQFLLFGGNFYYAAGGWHDFIGSFDSLVEAINEMSQHYNDWYHIVNTETMSVVWSSGDEEEQIIEEGTFDPERDEILPEEEQLELTPDEKTALIGGTWPLDEYGLTEGLRSLDGPADGTLRMARTRLRQ